MSIRKKIILILLCVIALYSVVQYGIERLVILPSFTSLQQTEAQKNIERCRNAIQNQIICLDDLCADWSGWDDTYKFVQDKNSDYIESNLVESTFTSPKLNLLSIYNLEGKVIWGKIYNLQNETYVDRKEFPKLSFGNDHMLLKHNSTESYIQGLYLTEQGPMLISSRPILTSEGQGPIRGTLIMGRFLDKNMIENFSRDLSIKFSVETIRDVSDKEQRKHLLGQISKDRPYVLEQDDNDLLHIYGLEYDVAGEPAILITVDVPATIIAKGRTATRFAFLSILLSGAIIIFVIYWVMKKTILGRLAGISESIDEVIEKRDFSVRTSVCGSDELGRLGDNLNNMLKHVDKVEEALRASEEQYRGIFEAITDGLRIGTMDGQVVKVNQAFAQMHGYSTEELATLSPRHWINADSHNLFEQFIESIKAGKAFQCEGRDVRKDGSVFDVEVHGIPWNYQGKLHTLTIVRDITERKQLHEILDRKQKNLEAIFDAAPLGMILVDDQGFIKRVNDVLAKLVHRDFPEIINRQLGEGLACIHASNQADGCDNGTFCPKCPIRNIFEGVLSSWQATRGVEVQAGVLIDGKEANPWLEISAEPTYIDGNRHVVLAIQDITKRKHTEQALKEMMSQASMANTAKSQFLATMSHEIRTPMNAIIGFSNLLAESELTDEQKEHLNLVRESSHNLLRLIDDILDLSKIEAKKVDIDIAECSLGQLLNSVESLMMSKAKIEGLDFKIIEESGLPAQIRTDVTRVRQCLVNLAGNAIKFTREGHIYLRVSLQEIENTPFIRFDVEDTGIGIPKDKQDEIFETFVQADNSTSREFGGTGLGLTISKHLAELLGGQLTMSSEVGKGSVFSLTLPAGVDVTKQPSLDRQNITSHIVAGTDDTNQAKFSGHILVAEDARTNQVLIKSLLKRLGMQVTIAEDGNEVLQKALSKQFDLIFMDIEMPNMSGYEAAKAIRKEGLKTPIIALTAYAMKGDDEKCFAAGCDDYISKPIEHEELLQILSKYLSNESEDLNQQIDSVKSNVEQLNELCSETASSDTAETKPADEQYGELPVDFAIIKKIYDDEEVLKETVKVFLEEAPQTIELLAGAIEAKDSKNVKIHAHKLKGLARHVAARKLSDMLYLLETKGRKEELEGSEALFADIQTEFDTLKSFLSQPNWTESAGQQTDQKKIVKKT
ncbi:MAG: CHASE4 domain-containing protein [Planctomycetota bacterium]|jgi:PAS domain S-box-containing protein